MMLPIYCQHYEGLEGDQSGGQSRRHFLNALFYFVSHTSQGLSHSGSQYDKQVKRQEFLELLGCQNTNLKIFRDPENGTLISQS